MTDANNYPRGIEIVGGAVIQNDQGQILLVKSPKWQNKWLLPGGHIDPGESIMNSQVRETLEETGLTVKPITIFAWGELINSKNFHRPAHFIYFDVYCQLISGDLKLDNKELTDYKWLMPEQALQLDLAKSYHKTIQDFITYLSKK